MNLGSLPLDVGARFFDIGAERSSVILSILSTGWAHAMELQVVDARAGEVEITECLRSGMRRALNDRTEKWAKKMTVLPGTESRSGATLQPDGRTDIPILLQELREAYGDHDPHAIIECKRVAGNDPALCRRYVVDGIDDRFISAKYAARHRVAFMAGYVLSGSVDAVTGRINRYLSRRGRAAERLAACTALPATWARSSCHPRPSSDPPLIDLHHAFLTFPAVP